MQKYCLNKSVRIVELEEICFIYDCDKFVEYKLNGVASTLLTNILHNKDIEVKYTPFLSQLVLTGIIKVSDEND